MYINSLINPITVISSIFTLISLFIYIIDKKTIHFLFVNLVLGGFNLLMAYINLPETQTTIENKELLTFLLSTIVIVSQVNLINKDLKFNDFIKKKSYNTFIVSILIALIILFILPLTILKDIPLAKELFLYPSISFGLLFTPYFISNSYSIFFGSFKSKNNRINTILSIYLITSIFIFSIFKFFFNQASNLFLNIYTYSFYVVYIYHWLIKIKQTNNSKVETKSTKELSKKAIIDIMIKLELSPREQDITMAIIDNPKASYKVLSDELFIDKNTISKHASNCFKKGNVSTKEEYIAIFQ